jgi:hypothetical protein
MTQLAETMSRAAFMFAALVDSKAADCDLSLWEIDQLLGELAVIQNALECAKAQFEAACEDAGGADARIPDRNIQCDNGATGAGEGAFS